MGENHMNEKAKHILPLEYEETYDQMLKDLSGVSARSKKQKEITAFWPMRGMYFKEGAGLMIIGRAVNGWAVKGCPGKEDLCGRGWKLKELESEEERQNLLDGVRYLSESGDCKRWRLQQKRNVNIRPKLEIDKSDYNCPLSWVVEKVESKKDSYNTNTSAFWRVNKAILGELYPETQSRSPWSSHLCWSNLHKIAPLKKGNPLKSWRDRSESYAKELLKLELGTFKPKRVLVVAGENWYRPFAEFLGMDIEDPDMNNLVEGVSEHNGQRWVFAKHPQTKPEKQFTSEVVKAFMKPHG
jgi:hypothetical protein